MVINKIINQPYQSIATHLAGGPLDTVFAQLLELLLQKNTTLRASMDEILSQPVVMERIRALFEAHPTLYQEDRVLYPGSPSLNNLGSPQIRKREELRKSGGGIKQNNIFYLIQQAKNAKTSSTEAKPKDESPAQKATIDFQAPKVDERPP